MKIYTLIFIGLIGVVGCNTKQNKKEVTEEENKELIKVENLQKTDKQKEDSVMALWEKKMKESKVGE